jgi:hypothetical protein
VRAGQDKGEIMPEPFTIELTLYSDNDDPKTTFRQSFIPWKMMKEAVKLIKKAEKFNNPENIDEETLDSLSDFVVAVFRDKFTREDLENGAEPSEVLTVIKQVVAKVSGPNPT